jgi:DNA-directed RNA polymerase subunit RPC12/RpoP
VKEVRGGTLEPGRYRKVQNYVVNSLTGEVIYTPAAPFKIKCPKCRIEFNLYSKFSEFSCPSCRTKISVREIVGGNQK